MGTSGSLLVAPSPNGPVQDRGGVGWRQAHESGQQVTDLGHGQRQQIRGEVGRDHTPR